MSAPLTKVTVAVEDVLVTVVDVRVSLAVVELDVRVSLMALLEVLLMELNVEVDVTGLVLSVAVVEVRLTVCDSVVSVVEICAVWVSGEDRFTTNIENGAPDSVDAV